MSTRDLGLPGIEELTRLANELFTAAPATPSSLPAPALPATPSGVPGASAVPSSLPPAPAGLPDYANLRGLVAAPPTLPNAAPAWSPNAAPAWSPSATPARSPGGAAAALPAAAPSSPTPAFYFLELPKPGSAAPANVKPPESPGYRYDADTLPHLGLAPGQLDIRAIRRDFPILDERVDGHQLVWLDNAATTQKPQAVIDRLAHFYTHENSNVHRGAHTLAARSSDAYEAARESVRRFLHADSAREIVFTRGATEAINLMAQSWGRRHVGPGDEIVISWIEHHSNIVPWQQLAAEKGARLRVAPVDDHGQIRLDEYERLLGPRTRIVSLTHVSNALGTIVPVREMTAMAHRYGACVLIDGAQAVSHMPVDVQAIDCDFYALSGHKLFAPTGIGALYGKQAVLETMPPWQGGGNMITDVTFEKTVYSPAPARFEAGTGSLGDAVGLGAAIDYLERIGMHNIAAYEHQLLEYGIQALQEIPGLHLVGTAREKAAVLSFMLDGYRAEEVGAALAQVGIAVRAGHHCAQPAVRRFGYEGTVRPSLAFYNDTSDIDALVQALERLRADRPAPRVPVR